MAEVYEKEYETLLHKLVQEVDFDKLCEVALKRGIIQKEQYDNVKENCKHCSEKRQLLQQLFAPLDKNYALLFLCLIFSDYEELQLVLHLNDYEQFESIASQKEILYEQVSIDVTRIYARDVTEFHNFLRLMIENGDLKTFMRMMNKVETDCKEIQEHLTALDNVEKKRRADFCICAVCIVSQFHEHDQVIHPLYGVATHAQKFATDKLEAEYLLKAAELQRWAHGDKQSKEDIQFPEAMRTYALEECQNVLTKGFILGAEIVFRISQLQQNYSAELEKNIKMNLENFDIVFGRKEKNKSEETFRKLLIQKKSCMLALIHLGMGFNLESIRAVKENLEVAKQYLVDIVKPNVLHSMSLKWQMLTYAAMSKWFSLNREKAKAMICAEYVQRIVQKLSLINKPLVIKNAKKLLELAQRNTSDAGNPSAFLPTVDFNERDPGAFENLLSFLQLEDLVIVKTSASVDCGWPYYQCILSINIKETEYDAAYEQTNKLIYQKQIHEAISSRDRGKIKHYIAKCDPLQSNSDGISPLLLAIQSQDLEIIADFEKEIIRLFLKEMGNKKHLLHLVWLGYIPKHEKGVSSKSDIRIVALYKEGLDPPPKTSFRNVAIYWRQYGKVNDEVRERIHYEDSGSLNKQKISGEEAEQLFNCHRHLNMIYVSSFKSTKFEVINEQCVALHCQIKGIIPLVEKPFPMAINGLKTDVREGHVALGVGDLLKHRSKMLCPYTHKTGTIGCFVDLPCGELKFITAAHIVAKCNDLSKIMQDQDVSFESQDNDILQADGRAKIGTVEKRCFWNADPSVPSVDAALVRADKNSISPTGLYKTSILVHEIASYKEMCEIRQTRVMKYGAQTGLTTGELAIEDIHTRFWDITTLDYNCADKLEVRMYGQMGIRNVDNKTFFEIGDSGSFCYIVDKENGSKIRSFGMAIGLSNGICIATPLTAVFHKLGLDNDQKFKLYPLPATSLNEIASQTDVEAPHTKEKDDAMNSMMKSLVDVVESMKTDANKHSKKQDEFMDEVKKEVSSLKTEAQKQSKHLKDVTEEVRSIKKDLNIVKEDVSVIKREMPHTEEDDL